MTRHIFYSTHIIFKNNNNNKNNNWEKQKHFSDDESKNEKINRSLLHLVYDCNLQ